MSSSELTVAELHALQNITFDWDNVKSSWVERKALRQEMQWIVTEGRWIIDETPNTGQPVGWYVGQRESKVMVIRDQEANGAESLLNVAVSDLGGTVIDQINLATEWEYTEYEPNEGDVTAMGKVMSEFFSEIEAQQFAGAQDRDVALFEQAFYRGLSWAAYQSKSKAQRHASPLPAEPTMIQPPKFEQAKQPESQIALDEFGFPL